MMDALSDPKSPPNSRSQFRRQKVTLPVGPVPLVPRPISLIHFYGLHHHRPCHQHMSFMPLPSQIHIMDTRILRVSALTLSPTYFLVPNIHPLPPIHRQNSLFSSPTPSIGRSCTRLSLLQPSSSSSIQRPVFLQLADPRDTGSSSRL